MSETKHTTTFEARDEASDVIESIGAAAGKAGVKLTAAAGVIEETAKGCGVLGDDAARLSTMVAGAGAAAGKYAETLGFAAKNSKTLSAETYAVGAAAKKAAEDTETFGGKLRSHAGFAADAMVALRGFASVAGTLARGLAKPFREAFRFEEISTRLAPLVGGMDTARATAERLRKEAANGTMSFEQLAGVAVKLGGVFSSTKNIEAWTSAFHNLSAAAGMDVNELVGNFVKMKAAGRVSAEFPEMFAKKGINIFGELEKQTGRSAAELRKMAQEGTLAFSEIETALLSLATGTGKFATAAADMSASAGGSVETLSAQWDILLAKFARPLAVAVTPMIRRLSELGEKLEPVAELFGSVSAWAAGRFSNALGVAAGACVLLNRRLRGIAAGFSLSGILAQVRRLPSALASSRASAGAFGVKFKAAMAASAAAVRAFGVAVKTTLVGTGVGALFVGIGEGIAWIYEKILGTGEAAENFADSMREMKEAAADLGKRFKDAADEHALDALREEIEQEEDAWRERLDAYEEGSEEYKTFAAEFEAWKRAAAEHSLAAEKRIEAKKLAERAKAQAEELARMRERSDALRAEIEREKREMLLASSLPQQKIQFTLSFAKVGSVRQLEEELRALAEASHLTKEQELHARELLDAKKKIAAVEREAESVRAGLREKISLLQAELEGNEKLLELKEQIRRAELREQFAKALPGASTEQVEEQLRKYLELEKAVEEKRRAQKAEKTLQEELVELERKRLRAAGDDAALKAFDAQNAAIKKYDELVAKGVEATTALAVARRHLNFDTGRASGEDLKRNFVGFDARFPAETADAGTLAGKSVPANAPTITGGISADAMASLVEISEAIRSDTRGILETLRQEGKQKKMIVNAVLS